MLCVLHSRSADTSSGKSVIMTLPCCRLTGPQSSMCVVDYVNTSRELPSHQFFLDTERF